MQSWLDESFYVDQAGLQLIDLLLCLLSATVNGPMLHLIWHFLLKKFLVYTTP